MSDHYPNLCPSSMHTLTCIALLRKSQPAVHVARPHHSLIPVLTSTVPRQWQLTRQWSIGWPTIVWLYIKWFDQRRETASMGIVWLGFNSFNRSWETAYASSKRYPSIPLVILDMGKISRWFDHLWHLCHTKQWRCNSNVQVGFTVFLKIAGIHAKMNCTALDISNRTASPTEQSP